MADITKQVSYVIEVTGADEARQAMSGLGGEASSATSSMGNLTRQFTLGGIAAGVATQAISAAANTVRKFLSDAIGLTQEIADLNDAMRGLYGASAPSLTREISSLSEATGYTRAELMRMSTDLGAMIIPLGVATNQAAEMSTNLTTLAVDMAAALGKDSTDMASAIEAGMRGAARGVRQYGIDVSEAAVNSELLRMGVEGGAQAASDAETVQARYNIIMEAASRYTGAAAAEVDTLEGSLRVLRNAYEEAAVQAGDAMSPSLQTLAESVTRLIEPLGQVLAPILQVLGTLLGSAINPLVGGLADLMEILDFVFDIFRAGQAVINDFLEPIYSLIGGLGELNSISLPEILDYLRELLGVEDEVTTATVSTSDAVKDLDDKFQNLSVSQLQAAQTALAHINVMGILSGQIAMIQDEIDAAQAELDSATSRSAELAELARQRKKDDDLARSTSPTSSRGITQEDQSFAAIPRNMNVLQGVSRLQINDQTTLNRLRERYSDSLERDIARSQQLVKETEQLETVWAGIFANMEEYGVNVFGRVVEQSILDFESLDDFVLDMIKRWAAELASAFAVQGLMSIINPGKAAGGFLGGVLGKVFG